MLNTGGSNLVISSLMIICALPENENAIYFTYAETVAPVQKQINDSVMLNCLGNMGGGQEERAVANA